MKHRHTRPTFWALRCVSFALAATGNDGAFTALRQLIAVAEERTRRSVGDGDDEVEILFSRLREWPLPVLFRCASVLHAARRVVRGCINTAAPRPTGTSLLFLPPFLQYDERSGGKKPQVVPRKQRTNSSSSSSSSFLSYRRLYNICCWQRRHPLFILSPVLDAFGGHLPCEALDDVLEAVSQRLAGALRGVPHLLRCDVLMAFHALPFEWQRRLMEALRPAYAAAATTAAADSSELPPPPEFYVGEYVRHVPPRFGAHDLSAEQYGELRRAFERHKQAGVKRLLSCAP